MAESQALWRCGQKITPKLQYCECENSMVTHILESGSVIERQEGDSILKWLCQGGN